MQRRDLDGLTVLSAPAPAPFTATLVFAVGRRHEAFLTGGITHLVEHLAMSAVGRPMLECNGQVQLGHTTFTATGNADDVVEVLRRLAAALPALPVERLATEAAVLRAEGGSYARPALGRHLAYRYGARGLGIAGFTEPTIGALDADAVTAWSNRYFVRENAVLCLSGPAPDGLDEALSALPHGDRSQRASDVALDIPYPVVSEGDVEEAVGLSFLAAESPALLAGIRIAMERAFIELRMRRGIVYHPDADVIDVAGDTLLVLLHADPLPVHQVEAGRGLLDIVRALASDGPTAAELRGDVARARLAVADPRAALAELDWAAADVLAGRPEHTDVERLAELELVTPAAVRDAFAAAAASLLVLVPGAAEAAELELPVDDGTRGAVLQGRTYARRLRSEAPRGSRLVIGADGLSIVLPSDTLTVRFADIIGATMAPEGYLTILGVDGTTMPLDRGDWRIGRAAFEHLLAQIPDAARFDREDACGGATHRGESHAAAAVWPPTPGRSTDDLAAEPPVPAPLS
ncbi:peptidase M16 family protein [Pengzhenrongella sicca]|uniref:Insulinase family protein n=1 Tax=Pengzhenrongella sicca TaxID=2819238 RepID=A0A8A4ZJF0_9MICO|nr:hypothetical protein [Pengzhenrongella sicca]QTE30626.1 insulinase family protein [Pengzhenrongella sicca]